VPSESISSNLSTCAMLRCPPRSHDATPWCVQAVTGRGSRNRSNATKWRSGPTVLQQPLTNILVKLRAETRAEKLPSQESGALVSAPTDIGCTNMRPLRVMAQDGVDAGVIAKDGDSACPKAQFEAAWALANILSANRSRRPSSRLAPSRLSYSCCRHLTMMFGTRPNIAGDGQGPRAACIH